VVQTIAPLTVIVGPTGAGKTETAILVALQIDAEIVNVDSRQVYRGLEIGSGAPTETERSQIPHHLVSIESPEHRISAGDFAREARSIIGELERQGKRIVLVGGSGLYLRAILDGLAPAPPSDPKVRREIEEEMNQRGFEALHLELASVDPRYSAMVGPRDRKRLVRALEVWRITGRSFSAWHNEQDHSKWREFVIFGLERPRVELRDLIRRRVSKMFTEGWVDEINKLMINGDLPEAVREAVGYRQIRDALRGEKTIEQAKEETIIATQQLAKRQMTWFKADPRVKWLNGSGSEAPHIWSDAILKELQRTGDLVEFR